MSKTETITVTPNEEGVFEVEAPKPTRIKRAVSYIKNHKKTTIAVASVAGLVVASAALGRTRPTSSPSPSRRTVRSTSSTFPPPWRTDHIPHKIHIPYKEHGFSQHQIT